MPKVDYDAVLRLAQVLRVGAWVVSGLLVVSTFNTLRVASSYGGEFSFLTFLVGLASVAAAWAGIRGSAYVLQLLVQIARQGDSTGDLIKAAERRATNTA